MSEIQEQLTTEQAMVEELRWATEQTIMLERDLAAIRFRRDDLILDLLGTKTSRKEISEAAQLAEISIYKIAARVRERRAKVAPVVEEKKVRTRKKKAKVEVPMPSINTDDVTAQPVLVDVPAGSHPLLNWTLAAVA